MLVRAAMGCAMLDTPVPISTVKLSNFGPRQLLDGRPLSMLPTGKWTGLQLHALVSGSMSCWCLSRVEHLQVRQKRLVSAEVA